MPTAYSNISPEIMTADVRASALPRTESRAASNSATVLSYLPRKKSARPVNSYTDVLRMLAQSHGEQALRTGELPCRIRQRSALHRVPAPTGVELREFKPGVQERITRPRDAHQRVDELHLAGCETDMPGGFDRTCLEPRFERVVLQRPQEDHAAPVDRVRPRWIEAGCPVEGHFGGVELRAETNERLGEMVVRRGGVRVRVRREAGTRKLPPRVDEAVELREPRHGRLWWGCSAAGGDGGERESAHDGAHGVGRNGAPAERCQFQTNVTTAPAGRG